LRRIPLSIEWCRVVFFFSSGPFYRSDPCSPCPHFCCHVSQPFARVCRFPPPPRRSLWMAFRLAVIVVRLPLLWPPMVPSILFFDPRWDSPAQVAIPHGRIHFVRPLRVWEAHDLFVSCPWQGHPGPLGFSRIPFSTGNLPSAPLPNTLLFFPRASSTFRQSGIAFQLYLSGFLLGTPVLAY